jgi:2-methylcitrate dehydratase PrpD
VDYGVASLNLNITNGLCSFLSDLKFEDLPQEAVHAGRRGILDWVGCALIGSTHPTVTTVLEVLAASSETQHATIFGHELRSGVLEAPIANGLMGHVLDFDDTHMNGVVLHASSPVLAALFALAEKRPTAGFEFLTAYVAGFEAGVRVGQASPGHHRGGWHLTGTLGSIAAGAASGRLLALTAGQLTHAVGIATTQAAGMQQNRGTMCKSFHAGKAAQNGVLAALLAERGFDSSEEIIEGKKGFCRIYSDVANPELVLDELGTRWEIARNGYKPYACGVLMHPAIDAMIELGTAVAADVSRIEAVEAVVHPLAVSVTGISDPRSGLQSKFSLTHSAAVALLDRTAGILQYTDERALSPDVLALSKKIKVTTDESLRTDEASASVVVGGRRVEAVVEHATGTIANPMSDALLESKFFSNASAILGTERATALRDKIWAIESITDVREITALCIPN